MKGKDRKKKLKNYSLSKKPISKSTKKQKRGALEVTTIQEGDQVKFPKRGQKVTVSYEGRLEDGIVFDKNNSFKFQVGVGEVIKGWDQAVMKMSVGQKVEAIVPAHLGYGSQGAPPTIPRNATLIFKITLLKV